MADEILPIVVQPDGQEGGHGAGEGQVGRGIRRQGSLTPRCPGEALQEWGPRPSAQGCRRPVLLLVLPATGLLIEEGLARSLCAWELMTSGVTITVFPGEPSLPWVCPASLMRGPQGVSFH